MSKSQLKDARDLDRRKLIQQVADELDLYMYEVEDAVKAQFDFLAETMAAGNFDAVRLPKLGLFHVRKGRIEHLNRHKQ